MRVFYSPAYCDTTVAFDTTRKAAAIAASFATDPVPGVTVVAPTPATRDELVAVHNPEYVDAVLDGDPLRLAASNGIGWDDGLARAVCASTGGVRDVALHALGKRTVAGSLSSGLHHAKAGRGHGYCTINGLVVAAHAALRHGARRILILDLDAHCGGGTASLIAGVDGVEQVDVSVNHFDEYTSRPDARLTVSNGADYLEVIARELDRIDAADTIDLVLYNAGMDPHRHAGGHPAIDTLMLHQRERLVFDWARSFHLPVARVLAGGYTINIDMPALVDLHRLTISAAVGYEAEVGSDTANSAIGTTSMRSDRA